MRLPNGAKPDKIDIAEKTLLDAAAQIRRAHDEHGHTELSFTMVGEMWSIYITHIFTIRGSNKIEARDVAHMLGLLKKARATYGYSEDNFVDEAGYTSLAAMLTSPPPVPDRHLPNAPNLTQMEPKPTQTLATTRLGQVRIEP